MTIFRSTMLAAALLVVPACGTGTDEGMALLGTGADQAEHPSRDLQSNPGSGGATGGEAGAPGYDAGTQEAFTESPSESSEPAGTRPGDPGASRTATKSTKVDDRDSEVDDNGRPVTHDGAEVNSGSGPGSGKNPSNPPPGTKATVTTDGKADDESTGDGDDGLTPPPGGNDRALVRWNSPQGNPSPGPPIKEIRAMLLEDRERTIDLGINGWVNGISDDGGTVVVAHPEGGNTVNLVKVDVDSGTVTPITRGEATWGNADVLGHRLTMAGNLERAAQIGRAHTAAGPPQSPEPATPEPVDFEIFAVNDDGTGLTQLTDNRAHDTLPDWSPDGARIAYTSDEDGDFDLYVMNADGTDRRRLTDNTVEDGFPSWSPDGTEIAYASMADGDYDIYVMPAEGGEARPVTANPIDDIFPEWTKEGIAFSREQDGDFELYFAGEEAADGSDPGQPKERLTRNQVDDAFPAASADSDTIAFTRLEEKPPAEPATNSPDPSTSSSAPRLTVPGRPPGEDRLVFP